MNTCLYLVLSFLSNILNTFLTFTGLKLTNFKYCKYSWHSLV